MSVKSPTIKLNNATAATIASELIKLDAQMEKKLGVQGKSNTRSPEKQSGVAHKNAQGLQALVGRGKLPEHQAKAPVVAKLSEKGVNYDNPLVKSGPGLHFLKWEKAEIKAEAAAKRGVTPSYNPHSARVEQPGNQTGYVAVVQHLRDLASGHRHKKTGV